MVVGIQDILQLSTSTISLKTGGGLASKVVFSVSTQFNFFKQGQMRTKPQNFENRKIQKRPGWKNNCSTNFVFKVMTNLTWKREEKKPVTCNEKIRRAEEGEVRYARGMRRLSICSKFQQGYGVLQGRTFRLMEKGRFVMCVYHTAALVATLALGICLYLICFDAPWQPSFCLSPLCRRIQRNTATVEISWSVKKKKKTGRWGIFFFF